MILDMRHDNYDRTDAREATIIVNASLGEFTDHNLDCNNAKIISFDSFKDEQVCSATKIADFLNKREFFCPNLELIDLSRACSPDVDLESHEAKRFYRFVKTFKDNTDIDIIATPELEKLFPVLLPQDEEDDNLLEAYVIPLKEEKLSALQAITELQLAQAEGKLSPDLYREILEHNNNNVVVQSVISAIDKQLSEGTEQIDRYIPTLLGCIAGRYVSSDNFDAIVDIAEKHISPDNITTEDINFCFGLQKESSQSEENSQRINNLIKGLIPHLPEEVRQDLDAKAALKEKKQQEYIQKRQKLQAKVDEYSGYLILSDTLDESPTSEHIRKIADTIYENAGKYPDLYVKILDKINKEQDPYKIRAAAHWIEPTVSRINTLGKSGPNIRLIKNLTEVVTQNQDVRHQFGHIFCGQLKGNNDSEFWMKRIKSLMHNNSNDHILLMNTYEDMEQAYKMRPELIQKSLEIFKDTLAFEGIGNGFNDHLHTLASIVGDTAQEHPEFSDAAMDILSDLTHIEKNLSGSSAKSYLRSKIDEAFNKIKQNDMTSSSKRNLLIIHEKDQAVFADVVKELINDPQTEQQHIEKAIEMRLNNGLDVLIDDYDSAECFKWNLSVLQSKALQNKGPEEISACAEHIFKNGILKKLENDPNYDPSEAFQVIYDAAPFWLKKLRENISDTEDLLVLQHFDRIPKEAQNLYIGEYTGKIDNLITTDTLKKFPELAALQLKMEVCDYISDISSSSAYEKERSLSDMEKWANFLKENNGYSSPEACVLALNEAIRIRTSISLPYEYYSCEYACQHFSKSKEDVKQFVKISTDIIDNVFEQICQHKDDTSLKDALNDARFPGVKEKMHLQAIMGTEAAQAFLSGDKKYKVLWDKKTVENFMNAYLMLEKKPYEIVQDLPLDKRKHYLDMMCRNTDEHDTIWKDLWKDFPELLHPYTLHEQIMNCEDKADKTVVQAVKTYYKARIDETIPEDDFLLLKSLMVVYDAEAKKGIEDKELFSILYKNRFSKDRASIRKFMNRIYDSEKLTAPKLKSLCQTSHLVNKWWLKKSTNENC